MSAPYKVESISIILSDIGEACAVRVKLDPAPPEGVELTFDEDPQPCMLMATAILKVLQEQAEETTKRQPFSGMRLVK